MSKIYLFLLVFMVFSVAGQSPKINGYEYWLNQQHEIKTVEDIVPVQDFNLQTNINTHDVPDGLNSLSIRFRDTENLWSATLTRFFVKVPAWFDENSTINKIVGYEYGFNQDMPTFRALSNVQQLNIEELFSALELPDGLNSFSIRFKDSAGNWSSMLTRFFVKLPVWDGIFQDNTVASYQIWFNNDTSAMQENSIVAGASFTLLKDLPSSDLSHGLNTVNLRFKDERGHWSSVKSQFFVKLPQHDPPGENLMYAYEYWLEDVEGNFYDHQGKTGRTFIDLNEPINPLLLNLELNLSRLPASNYFLMFRFLDIRDQWSEVISHEILKKAQPFALFSAGDNTACSNNPVIFSNFSVDADTWLWDFGDGTQSSEFEPQHIFTEPGKYTITLTASDMESGKEHTSSTELEVFSDYLISTDQQICENDMFTWQGNEYNSPGTYTAEYKTVNGCDSVLVLNLAVTPTYFFEEVQQICQGDSLNWHGDEYSQSGSYTRTYSTSAGCDSTFVLHLTVNPTFQSVQDAWICENDTFTWQGNEYNSPGTYTAEYKTVNGCDSVLVLNLAVTSVNNQVVQDSLTLMALAEGAYFQWINCADDSFIEGEINATFGPSQSGSYAVWVTQNECTALSDCFQVQITGINENEWYPSVIISPNPSYNHLNISFKEDYSDFSLAIYTVNGQLIYHKKNLSGNQYNLVLPKLTSGVYILQLEYMGYKRNVRFIRQ